jgi:NTE family protein
MPTLSSDVLPDQPPAAAPLPVSLGLQGGGSYGAFTWGVLDRLLAEPRLRFDAISGTSAGAINALVMADGMADGGGARGAQAALHRFWRGLCDASLASPVQRTPFDYLLGRWTLESSPGYHLMQTMSMLMAPIQAMPFAIDPIRQLLSTLIDFERVRACECLRLFIHAINVRTGKGRIFKHAALNVNHLMAAICLPQVMAAVEIDGEAYWDGSYVGNPALAPLISPGGARDLLIVQINPVARKELPTSITDINSRVNEMAFNTSILREIAAISQLQQLIDEFASEKARAAAVRLHLISGTDTLTNYSHSSKYNTEWAFLTHLHALGAKAADAWLVNNFAQVGHASTLVPETLYHPEDSIDP